MSDLLDRQILLIGLPNTGKTSFLAALWFMVNQSTVKCRLTLEKLFGDSKYLNEICEAWLEYRPVKRNQLDSVKLVAMTLKNRENDRLVRLSIPDLSGESFSLQWTNRQLTSGYDEQLRKASGGILFVHPEGIVKPTRIDTVTELAMASGDVVPLENIEQTATAETKPWDSGKSPTQVQLVELLQFISSRVHFQPPFRLAIVVSAWDLLIDLSETPEKWVSDQLPLLRQFLSCHKSIFDVVFYGVSAQGGRYDSSPIPQKLPAHRVSVVGDSVSNSHDITEPIQWLMH